MIWRSDFDVRVALGEMPGEDLPYLLSFIRGSHAVPPQQLALALQRQPGDLPAHHEPLEEELGATLPAVLGRRGGPGVEVAKLAQRAGAQLVAQREHVAVGVGVVGGACGGLSATLGPAAAALSHRDGILAAILDDVLDFLHCPHCRATLTRAGGAVRCAAGHSFDVARQGYLSLLPGDAQLGSADSAEMVAARERFLGAGYLDPLAAALEAEARTECRAGGCVLDLGAGTGWYLARVLEALPGRLGLALDLSKHALRRAARAHDRIGAVAADAWRPLPVRTGVAALALSVFAPRNGAELARTLAAGGALIVVSPAEHHLTELVEALGLLSVDERKRERLAAKLDPHFGPASVSTLEWTLELSRAAARDAVAMGPSAVHTDPGRAIAGLDEPLSVTAAVEISVRRKP